MRAAVLRAHGAAPEVGSHPMPSLSAPSLSAGQVLVRVTAAPINPLDLLCASGTSYFGAPALPYVPGAQGVGVVEESSAGSAEASGGPASGGAASGGLAVGQRVWFSCSAGMAPGDGAMAEYCVVDSASVLPLPSGVADDLVAALGSSAVAAWMALTWRGGVAAGERVLVLGASGTVGQVGVQAARLLGASRVIAACRDPHGRDRALELGADAVADLTGSDVASIGARLSEASAGPVDLVLDPVWGLPAEAALGLLAPRGRLVNLGSSAGPMASLGSAPLRSGVLSVLGYTNNALSPAQRAEALAEVLEHAAAGRLTTDREIVPLSDAASAWSRCGTAPHKRAVLVP